MRLNRSICYREQTRRKVIRMKFNDNLIRLGMQYFAEGDPGAGSDGNGGSGEPGAGGTGTETKTFTQEEVNRMMAAEKRQGRASVLSELGYDPKDKEAITKLKALIDGNKTEEQKKADKEQELTNAAAEANRRAEAAERKLQALSSGCDPAAVDDVMTLASSRVTEDVDFTKALEQVKEKYPNFFGGGTGGDSGTGRGQGHKKHSEDNKPGSYGARLAANRSKPAKSPYFNN